MSNFLKLSPIKIASDSITREMKGRRDFFGKVVGVAAIFSPFAVSAQVAAIDPSAGVVQVMTANARAAVGVQGAAFKVTIKGIASQISSRPANDRTGDAIVTINGEEIRIKANSSFNANVNLSNLKTVSTFWSCFITSMISMIGIAAWNNVKNNYQAFWNSTSGVWWKRVLQFLQKIFTLPYATYALQSLTKCK